MLTQWVEWEVTLGRVKGAGGAGGAGGQSAGSAACAEARAREAGLRRPGSARRAGVMAELGQTLHQPGLAPDLLALGPAELSLSPPAPPFYPQEQTFPACWPLRGLEGGQNPHSPSARLCDLGQLAPPPWVLWALNPGIAGADFWAPPACSFFDVILEA